MTKEMLDILVSALSAPSWVDILLLIVTTAYFIATVFVYRANKKMAKAAEDQIRTATQMASLSRNVELYDRRIELIEYVTGYNEYDICHKYNFQMKLSLLFPSKDVQTVFHDFVSCYKQVEEKNSEIRAFLKLSKDLPIRGTALHDQITKALENPDNTSELARVEKLANDNTIEIIKGGVKQILNVFQLSKDVDNGIKERKYLKIHLMEKMREFVERSITINER